MKKLRLKLGSVIGMCVVLLAQYAWAISAMPAGDDFQRLFELIQLEDLKAPLVPFLDQNVEFDRSLNQENLAYLNKDNDLLAQIKSRFQGEALQWKLAHSYKQLLVVPENRADYAGLFKSYCDEAVSYTLHATQLENPLRSIEILQGGVSEIGHHPSDGSVTAYLVHNIADEYVEEYLFFGQADESEAIQIKLSNLEFSGNIGSYSSNIVIGENGHFEFVHNPYTLWQNSAEDPLNVFVVPVEETLHIALRDATEIAIQDKLKQIAPRTVDEVQQVVDEWMAVEEAIVGGLVSELMPEILSRVFGGPLTAEMNRSFEDRHAHSQYRYLENGIRIVTDLGLQPAIRLYKSTPLKFKQMLTTEPVG